MVTGMSSMFLFTVSILFILSSVNGLLDCFWCWAMMNNASVNISTQVFLWTYILFLLGRFLGVCRCILNYIRKCQTLLQNGHTYQ